MVRRATQHLINIRMISQIMGWLLIIEAVFLLFPAITSLAYGEADWKPFAITSVVTTAVGLLMAFKSRPTSMHLGKRDGYLLTASVWVVFSIFGLQPFIFCSTPLSFSDAFFEAMSGFTTTGASALGSVNGMSHGVHLWRAMMQWIGGMGIILFTLAIIPTLNHAGGMQMFNAEVTGITHDKISPRINQTAKNLWYVYLLLTVALIALLWAGPMNLFDSICHGFGAISTGGYATSPDGMMAWKDSVYVKVVLTAFMFLGGVNFALIFRAAHGNFRAVAENDVFKTYLKVIGVMLILFVASILLQGKVFDWQSISIDPLFHIISTITSTGYYLPGVENWDSFIIALTFVLMFSGACAGSTSGGAKIDRVLYLVKNVHNELYRCIHPQSIKAVKINGRVMPPELVTKVIAFLCIYVLLVVAGGIILTAFNVPIVDAFFASLSCLSNTGFDASITCCGSSFSILPDAAKWVLAFLMLVGRLELFTVLSLFTRTFWRR